MYRVVVVVVAFGSHALTMVQLVRNVEQYLLHERGPNTGLVIHDMAAPHSMAC